MLKKCKGTWRVPTYIAVISQKSCNTRIVTISTSWIASNVIFAIPTTQTCAIFTKRSTCTIWEPKMKIKEIIIIKNHQDTKANIQQGKSFYVLNRFRENSVQDFFKTSLIRKKTSRLKLTKLELDMYFLSSYIWYVLLIYTTCFKWTLLNAAKNKDFFRWPENMMPNESFD